MSKRGSEVHMAGGSGLFDVPPEHLPGLVALALFPVVWWVAVFGVRSSAAHGHRWAVGVRRRYDTVPAAGRFALVAMALGAVVHSAIVPTHWVDSRLTAVFFMVDAAGFIAVGAWTLVHGRFWRIGAFAILAGTAAGYVFYLLRHWETADIVGVITSTAELAAALVVLVPESAESNVPAGGSRWATVMAVPLAVLTLLGTVAIADSGQASATPTRSGDSPAPEAAGPAGMAMGSSPGATTLSLPTNSPAGDVVWPQPSGSMPPGMEMVPADCTQTPSPAQSKAAVTLVNSTVAAASPYTSLAAAKAAGYVPVTRTGARIVHYINYSVLEHSTPLDPKAIPALVYVNTTRGAVLVAAMYLMTSQAGGAPPQPGGCLTDWHRHTDLCFSGSQVEGNTVSRGSCAAGTTNKVTQPMLHVWMVPTLGGPLAGDPGAVSEVTGAVGMAPVTPANGVA